jgi:hypothetical protein
VQLFALGARLLHRGSRLLAGSTGCRSITTLHRSTRGFLVWAHSCSQLLHLWLISLVDRADLCPLRIRKAELLIEMPEPVTLAVLLARRSLRACRAGSGY